MYSTPPPRAMRPLAWLPNNPGMLFLGVKHDGARVTCTVRQVDGLCRVDGAALADLAGWLPMPMGAGR